MPVTIVSSKEQLVIPKEIRDTLGIKPKQKVLLKIAKGHAVIEPLPEKPIENFCGIFKEGTSLTKGSGKNNLLFYRAQFYVRFGRSDRPGPQV